MQVEGQVNFFGPQNTAGVSQEKGFAVFSQIVEVNGDQVSNITNILNNKSIKCLRTARPK